MHFHYASSPPLPSPARAGKVLFDTVGDWHFDKRDHDPTPVPRGLKQPASTVHFPLGRELIRCVWGGWRRVREGGRGRCVVHNNRARLFCNSHSAPLNGATMWRS